MTLRFLAKEPVSAKVLGGIGLKSTPDEWDGISDLDTEPHLKQHASCSGFMIVLRPNKMSRSTVTEKQKHRGLAFDQTRLTGNPLGFPKCDCPLCFGGRLP